MTLLVSQLVNGLVLGVLFILIAVGLSIIFGMLGLVNFAHGAFFALGAYFALSLRPWIGPVGLLFIAPALVAAVGMIVERTLLRPLYDKEPLLGLLLTFGLALFIEELIRVIWGSLGHPFDAPAFLSGVFHYGPIIVTNYRLAVLVVTVVLLVCVWLFLEKTPYGRIIRAGSRDGEMVSMLGINLTRVFMVVFGIGTALADDPELTCRTPGLEARSPLRIVLDRRMELPPISKLVRSASNVPVLAASIAGPAASSELNARRAALADAGVGLLEAETLGTFLSGLAVRGISSLLVEGGAGVAASFLAAGLVDRILLFEGAATVGEGGLASPLTRADMPDSFRLQREYAFGPDRLFEYERFS